MNQRQMTLKTFLIKLTLSTALISLPAQVNASMVVAKSDEYSDTSVALYKHHKYSNETICTHFHIPKSTQSVFDDPSNQGEGVVQFYETMITGFSFLEDYKRTGDFDPLERSAFKTFFAPLIKDQTFHEYIDVMLTNKSSSHDFYRSLDGRACVHNDGLRFLQSLRSILSHLQKKTRISDPEIANYFLFRAYLEQPKIDNLFTSFLLPEDKPYYLRVHAGIQWFDNQVIQILMGCSLETINITGDEEKGEILIPYHLWDSILSFKSINYTSISKDSVPFYFYYSKPIRQEGQVDEMRLTLASSSPFLNVSNSLIHTHHSHYYLGFHYTELTSKLEGATDSVQSAMILNKDGSIYSQKNLFFVRNDDKINKTEYFYDCVLSQYVFHKFEDIVDTRNEELISPYEKLLIDLAGGIEAVKQKGLVSFSEIIQEHAGETQEELAFFLSCLTYLQAEPEASPVYNELISKFENRLLTYYDTTLSPAEVAHITEGLQTQLSAETDLLVDDALENHDPEIIQEINDYYTEKGIAKVIAVPKPASKGGAGGKKGKKAEVKKTISINKKDLLDFKQKKVAKRVETSLESEIQEKKQKKRAEALVRLKNKTLSDLNGLKHLSRSELGSILDGIREKVIELDVEETGEIGTRGSHQSTEVASSSGSTRLSVARRPEKKGYQVGTAKTIIKDHFEKIYRIF